MLYEAVTSLCHSMKDGSIICCRCPATKLIMIGDRYLTDIVYGNRHGMLTIRPSPLTQEGEPQTVRWVSECSSPHVRDETLQMPQQHITQTPLPLPLFPCDSALADHRVDLEGLTVLMTLTGTEA